MGDMTLRVCTLLWDANEQGKDFSSMYDENWVEKLYRSFRRNLTRPFHFICFTDRQRKFDDPDIGQVITPDLGRNGYADCIRPYALNLPMILCGLDTVVVDNIDHLADYCMDGGTFALPRDPYRPDIACNGVSLVPSGMRRVWTEHDGANDMVHVRRYPHVFIDDIFPGQVKSYKGHVKRRGWGGVKIVYFHGKEKPHELSDRVVREHWR